MLTQKFLIKRIHNDCAIKPNFIPIGNDILAHKRAKISNYLNDSDLEKDEKDRIKILKSQTEEY